MLQCIRSVVDEIHALQQRESHDSQLTSFSGKTDVSNSKQDAYTHV